MTTDVPTIEISKAMIAGFLISAYPLYKIIRAISVHVVPKFWDEWKHNARESKWATLVMMAILGPTIALSEGSDFQTHVQNKAAADEALSTAQANANNAILFSVKSPNETVNIGKYSINDGSMVGPQTSLSTYQVTLTSDGEVGSVNYAGGAMRPDVNLETASQLIVNSIESQQAVQVAENNVKQFEGTAASVFLPDLFNFRYYVIGGVWLFIMIVIGWPEKRPEKRK